MKNSQITESLLLLLKAEDPHVIIAAAEGLANIGMKDKVTLVVQRILQKETLDTHVRIHAAYVWILLDGNAETIAQIAKESLQVNGIWKTKATVLLECEFFPEMITLIENLMQFEWSGWLFDVFYNYIERHWKKDPLNWKIPLKLQNYLESAMKLNKPGKLELMYLLKYVKQIGIVNQ